MPQDRILVIGEALVDIVQEPGSAPVEHVGGSPANVAMGLARLDHRVDLATALGQDSRGERIADHVRSHGVELTESSFVSAPTSTAQVTFDDARNATYEFAIHWDLAPIEADATHIHTGSISAVIEPGGPVARAIMAASRDTATLSYDPNIRPSIMGDIDDVRDVVEAFIPLIDVVKASDEDIELLYPGRAVADVLDHWLGLGPGLVVLTRGAAGVAYRTRSGDLVELPTRADRVVDTVGAGDSFMAGLISGLVSLGLLGGPDERATLTNASSEDVRPAIDRGLATSGITVGHAGAYAPRRAELTSPELTSPELI